MNKVQKILTQYDIKEEDIPLIVEWVKLKIQIDMVVGGLM